MTTAVVARQLGDQYQRHFFWTQAARLLHVQSTIADVTFESSEARAFDDVTTGYRLPILDYAGNPIDRDCFQVKFQMVSAASITAESLIDPAFINASSVSLLERVRDAQRIYAASGTRVRLRFATTATIDPTDILAKVHSNDGGQIRLDLLAKGGPNGAMGKLRKRWREHLGLASDDELYTVLRPFYIDDRNGVMDVMRHKRDVQLMLAGLRPSEGSRSDPYDTLLMRLHAEGRVSFTAEELLSITKQEGLWVGRLPAIASARTLGIRSFSHRAEDMAETCDHLLDFVPVFDGRRIRDDGHWHGHLLPKLAEFLRTHAVTGSRCVLDLQAHTSVGFAAGHLLDSKSGVNAVPLQRFRGIQLWEATEPNHRADVGVAEFLPCGTAGDELALAVSVTHDVENDVRSYCAATLPSVDEVLHIRIAPTPGSNALSGVEHALQFCGVIGEALQTARRLRPRTRIHVFLAVPIALAFLLGQRSRGWGAMTLYEFDFEAARFGAYLPSFKLP